MCIGIPKRIKSVEGFAGEFAWVERDDGSLRERVNMMLVGAQNIGGWVLTSLGMARETLTEDEAETINDAIAALEDALDGSYDPARHFADLQAD